MVDKKTKEFMRRHTSKVKRRKLGRALFTVPRSNLSLIPYYARMTFLVSRFFKDIKIDVLDQFSREYDELERTQDIVKLETKIRNSRFIGELTKF